MSHKKLHIHSTPLIAFALVATAVSVVSIGGLHSSLLTGTVLHSAIRLESTDHGYLKVMANNGNPTNVIADERPGAIVEGLPSVKNQSVADVTEAADSIGLQLTLSNAVR